MDIAYYISDLLGQQGELTVPNLGYFVQIRMAAYYDNHEHKFFPPHYAVQFDPQTIDEDDSLASYITSVKNISLASAKYFIEKYITNLKTQAVVEDVPFAQLGSFSSDGLKLIFHSASKLDDPAFFGYKPLEAYRVGESATQKPAAVFADEPVQPVVSEPIAPVAITPEPTFTPPVTTVYEQPKVAEEEEYFEEPSSGISLWLIVLIVFAMLAIALGALYKFRPDLFNRLLITPKKTTTTAAAKPAAAPTVDKDTMQLKEPVILDDSSAKTDTIQVPASQPDAKTKVTSEVQKPAPQVTAPAKKPAVVTTQAPPVTSPTVKTKTTPVSTPPVKTTTAPVTTTTVPVKTTTAPVNTAATLDVVPKRSWVIYSYVFPTKRGAERRVIELKSKGFTDARLLTDKVGPGGNYKVILGAFKTHAEALDKRTELLGTNKLRKEELSVELYK